MARRIISGLIGSMAAMLVAMGMLTTLVPLHAAGLGFDAATIGRIAGVYYLGFLAGPWIAPSLVARVGARGAFVLAALFAAVGIGGLPFLPYSAAWMALRFCTGAGFAILYIMVEAGLNARSSNADRGRLLSIYLIVSQSALVAGQALVGGIGIGGWEPFALATALVVLAAILHRLLPPTPAPAAAARFRPVRLFRIAPVAALGTMLFGLSEATFLALGPLFARDAGLSVAQVSAFMAAHMIGGAVSQWPLGALSDRIDRRVAVLIGAAGSTAVALALALSGSLAFWPAVIGAFLLGAFLLPLYGLLVALANDGAKADERVELSSGLVLAYAIGATVGPPLTASAMELDLRALPLSVVLVQGLLAAMLLAAVLRRPAPAPAHHADPLPAPDLAPVGPHVVDPA